MSVYGRPPSVRCMGRRPYDHLVARRLTRLLVGCAAVLVGWIGVLATTLGSAETVRHWSVTWVGLDVLEVAGLVATAVLFRLRSPLAASAGAATAALFAVDAWFDVTTAATGWPSLLAIVLALVLELPLAALCAWLSWYATARPPSATALENRAPTARRGIVEALAGVIDRGGPPARDAEPAAR